MLGARRATDLGPVLPHEHVFLDFVGAAEVSRSRYDSEAVFRAALPHLELLRDLGCQTLAECTPAYIGRDPLLLRRLSEASGLSILTNTGFYGAGKNRFLPRFVWSETVDELSSRWLKEWRDGIDGTGIRPGFIKIGVDAGPLSDLHRKLVRAAVRTHLVSGLTVMAHTGDGTAALEELAVVREEGADPSAFIWAHAQNEADTRLHVQAAQQGAWVEFDHVSSATVRDHLDLVQRMRTAGLLHRVLISHDAGWYEAGKPEGGDYRPYDTIFREFLPALKEAGFTQEEVDQLLVKNPRDAFTIRTRTSLATRAVTRN